MHSKVPEIGTVLQEGYQGLFSKAEQEALDLVVSIPESIEAPIEAGQVVGSAKLKLQDAVLAEIPILAVGSAPAFTLGNWYDYLWNHWVTWCE